MTGKPRIVGTNDDIHYVTNIYNFCLRLFHTHIIQLCIVQETYYLSFRSPKDKLIYFGDHNCKCIGQRAWREPSYILLRQPGLLKLESDRSDNMSTVDIEPGRYSIMNSKWETAILGSVDRGFITVGSRKEQEVQWHFCYVPGSIGTIFVRLQWFIRHSGNHYEIWDGRSGRYLTALKKESTAKVSIGQDPCLWNITCPYPEANSKLYTIKLAGCTLVLEMDRIPVKDDEPPVRCNEDFL